MVPVYIVYLTSRHKDTLLLIREELLLQCQRYAGSNVHEICIFK